MLGNYLKFNSNLFPNPVSASENSKTIENVSQSESGTDLVCVVRASKMNWSFTFNLSKGKRDILKALCEEESTQMNYMGKNYIVRLRDFKDSLVEGSEWLSAVNGLYECSVSVTEF